MAKVAVVAVQSNLIGRRAKPAFNPANPGAGHLWPSEFQPNASGQYLAEIVALYVGDLDEGGSLKYVLRDVMTGKLKVVYDHSFTVEGLE